MKPSVEEDGIWQELNPNPNPMVRLRMLAIKQIRALAKDGHDRVGARLSLARKIHKTQ
jgi:hypothetical protein